MQVHRAQALCYGWIYMEAHDLERIDIQMTYGQLDTEEIRRFRETIAREKLEKWYQDLTDEYYKWVSYQLAWRKERNASMELWNSRFHTAKGREKWSPEFTMRSQKRRRFLSSSDRDR